MSKVYDATGLKQTGEELMKKISDDVNDSSRLLYGFVPSVLKVTPQQYKSLAGQEAFDSMHNVYELTGRILPDDDFKMFRTQDNPIDSRKGGFVLEVEIHDPQA